MLQLIDITKTYQAGSVPTSVLRGVSFTVGKGEFVAIMGASGTGKTTLMNILGCLDVPTSGKYLLDGVDVFEHDDDAISAIRNRKIGFVFQQFHLLDRASALDNVLLPLTYADQSPGRCHRERRGRPSGRRPRRPDRYRPSQLSGGQQQRVAIARALVTSPALILADEPTGNLDRRSGLEVIAILQKLHGEGRTILLITHDQTIAEHAGRILELREGRMFENQTARLHLNAEQELLALAGGEQ